MLSAIVNPYEGVLPKKRESKDKNGKIAFMQSHLPVFLI
jgi:hypothetical protein